MPILKKKIFFVQNKFVKPLYLPMHSVEASVSSYVGRSMSLVSLVLHQLSMGTSLAMSSSLLRTSGQSPKLIKNSTSGSLT